MQGKKKYYPLLIQLSCIIGFLINLYSAWPGYLSVDSFDQYEQALLNHYNDWHAPLMAYVWHILMLLHKGPALMLILQLGLLWFALYIWLSCYANAYWYAAIMLLAAAPFVQNFAGYIVKDAQMSFSWMLCLGLLFRALVRKKSLPLPLLLLVALLLVYGSWVRINAWPGALAICALILKVQKPKFTLRKLVPLSVFFTFLIVAASSLFNYHWLHADKTYPQAKLYLHDISGIYARTGQSYYPAFLFTSPLVDTAKMRTYYHPATFDHLWVSAADTVIYDFQDDSTVSVLKQQWLSAIYHHPAAYIQNRADGLLYYLKIKQSRWPYYAAYFNISPQPNRMGISQSPNYLRNSISKAINAQANMPYMRPWFWLLLNSLLLFCGAKIKEPSHRYTFRALVFSSLFYMLPTFLIFPCDSDFRYFYWNCISLSIAVCLWFIDRKLQHK